MNQNVLTIRQNYRFFNGMIPKISLLDPALILPTINFSSNIQSLVGIILSSESSLNDKIETINNLKNFIIQAYSKTIFRIPSEFVHSIFSSISMYPELGRYIYPFLTDLISKYPNQIYEIFLETNIYEATILFIHPEIDEIYHDILIFLCKTLEQIPESINMLISLDLINRLKQMDQHRCTDKLLFIYYRSLLTDLSKDIALFNYVFHFLSDGNISIIINSLFFIKKFLDLHQIESLDHSIILNENLSFLLTLFNSPLVPLTINLYSSICSYGDIPISILFEEHKIINRIASFIYDYLNDQSQNNDSCSSAINFLLSIVVNVQLDNNVLLAFELIHCFDFKSNLTLFNYENQEKIFYIIMVLLRKVVLAQAKELINQKLLMHLADISTIDQEKTEIFVKTMKLAYERYSADKDFILMFNEILLIHDFEYEVL